MLNNSDILLTQTGYTEHVCCLDLLAGVGSGPIRTAWGECDPSSVSQQLQARICVSPLRRAQDTVVAPGESALVAWKKGSFSSGAVIPGLRLAAETKARPVKALLRVESIQPPQGCSQGSMGTTSFYSFVNAYFLKIGWHLLFEWFAEGCQRIYFVLCMNLLQQNVCFYVVSS